MNEKEIQEVLDELHTVRPEVLNEKGKRLFKAITKIADERDFYKNIIKEVREYIKNNKLYNEEYYTHNGYKYIKSVDDFSSRQYLLYLLDKGE